MSRDGARVAEPRFWESGWLWLALGLLSALPMLIPPMPVMPDHFAHMARFHVMNHGAESEFLSRYFSFKWALIGNLGVDLLMVPLGQLLPTEQAATLAVATIPPLTVAGIYALARAVHGRVPATALLALMSIYSFTFLYGFENYHMSVALGLLCAAAWIALADRPAWLHWLLIAPFSFLVWLAHFAGWGAMGLIVLGWELSRIRSGRLLPQFSNIVWRMLPLASPLALLPLWRAGASSNQHPILNGPLIKFRHLVEFFRGEFLWVDIVILVVFSLTTGWMLWRLWRQSNRGMLAALVLMVLAWLAMPWSMLSSYYADQRLVVVVVVLFMLAFPLWDGPRARAVALIALALFSVRIAEISIGWTQRGYGLQAELKALDQVPRGSRIASMALLSMCTPEAPNGIGHLTSPLHGHDHLANLAIIRREAFVNTQWDVAGSQLMRPIYNRDYGYNNDMSAHFGRSRGRCFGNDLQTLVDWLPRDRFDFVWIFDAPVERPWLEPIFIGAHGRLYRIKRDGA